MENKNCTICKKRFTRQWNLERHMQDIHHISKYGENDMVKQKYEGSPYSNPSIFKNEQLRNFENNMTEMDYNQNPPENHTFSNYYSRENLYNNRFYGNFEPFPLEKKENRLTIRDIVRIRRGLQILKNFLQQIYPNQIVIPQIYWLNYLCYTRNSIQPLREFYQKYNLMYLWPIYTDILTITAIFNSMKKNLFS